VKDARQKVKGEMPMDRRAHPVIELILRERLGMEVIAAQWNLIFLVYFVSLV